MVFISDRMKNIDRHDLKLHWAWFWNNSLWNYVFLLSFWGLYRLIILLSVAETMASLLMKKHCGSETGENSETDPVKQLIESNIANVMKSFFKMP